MKSTRFLDSDAMVVVMGAFVMLIVLGGLSLYNRRVEFPVCYPRTKRPWTKWELFNFKWNPWYDWASLENEYLHKNPTREAPVTWVKH